MGLPFAFLLFFLALAVRPFLIGSFFSRHVNRRGQTTGHLKLQSEDEKAVARYCEQLLADPVVTSLQILNLKGVLKVEEASFYLKPFENEPTARKFQPLSPVAALSQYPRLVVLGNAGTGKSTMLRALAVASATGQIEGLPDLPVIISLPEFARSSAPRLLDYTIRRLETVLGGNSRREFIEEKLSKGQILLLFDGLDEIQPRHDAGMELIYRAVSEQLNRLAKKYPAASIVVSCRRAGWRNTLPEFKPLELVELGWEDIQDFIRRWSAVRRRPELFRPLAAALLQSTGLRALAANPLLLALICLVYERRSDLPQRRSELFEWCIEALLEEAENRRSPETSHLKPEYKRALLRKVALHFHLRHQRDFPREEMLQVVNPFLAELGLNNEAISGTLEELVSEQGLLREQADGMFGFAHISLQEYFAAEAIAENQYYGFLPKVLEHPWWQEVIVLLSGLGNSDRVLRLIQASNSEKRYRTVSLACRCLANQPPLDNPDLAASVLVEAMQLVLDVAVGYEEKAEVVEALSQIKDQVIISYFSQLFQMQDVLKFLRWDLYARVILNLVQLGFAESYPVVFQLLTRLEIDNDFKQKLIDAAVIVGESSGALQHLREILPSLTGDVRAKAVLVLLQRGDDSLVMPAIALLQDHYIDINLKRRLLGALSILLSPNAFLAEIWPLLQGDTLGASSLQLRALELAVRRGGSEAIIALLNRLTEHPDRFTQSIARRIILLAGRFGEAEVVPHLLHLLNYCDPTGQAVVDDQLKKQALAAIAALATVDHTFALRHWLRQAEIDAYSQSIAALARSLSDQEETRKVADRFLTGTNGKRSELELELRKLANETRRSMATIGTGYLNDTDYYYGWPIGSY